MKKIPKIEKPFLIYIPCFNCAGSVLRVIQEIPSSFHERAEVLVIDNCSDDDTGEILRLQLDNHPVNIPVSIIRTCENLGYAGSQKLAYWIACQNESVRNVIMLHGDGQYLPSLIDRFLPLCDTEIDLAYGYRSKLKFGRKEETPFFTFAVIRILSILESILTLTFRKEWHSGFVMYSTRFLQRVPFQILTDTPHLDGHLLFVSKKLNARVISVPIYKKYINLKAFDGDERLKYVMSVFKLMFQFHKLDYEQKRDVYMWSREDFEILK